MRKNNIKLSKIKPEDGSLDDGVKRIYVKRIEPFETNLGWVDHHETFNSLKGVIFPEEMKIIIHVCENFSLFYDNIQG